MEILFEMRRNLVRWGDELHAIKGELIFRRLMRVAAMKAGYNSAEPRDDHGRWTAGERSFIKVAAANNAAECDFQYKQDKLICNLVQTRLCWAQAAERYGACLAGRPIPQLRF